jgi:hypothetical protein
MQQEQINLRKYYESNGYVVMPGLITTDKVESLLKAYREQIVPSKAKFFGKTPMFMRPTVLRAVVT